MKCVTVSLKFLIIQLGCSKAISTVKNASAIEVTTDGNQFIRRRLRA